MTLSRPNSAMNQGRPAAGRDQETLSLGRKRRAARSIKLWRYVCVRTSCAVCKRGASSSHSSRLSGILGRGLLKAAQLCPGPKTIPSTTVDTSTQQRQESLGGSSRWKRARSADSSPGVPNVTMVPRLKPSLWSERDPVGVHLDAGRSTLRPWVLDLEEIGEVSAEAQLQLQVCGQRTVVGDDQILVDAVRDKPIPPHRHGGVLADTRSGQRGVNAGGVVVDDAAAQHAERLSIGQQLPGGEVPHIGIEVAAGVRSRLDVAGRRRDEEGAAVEND